MTFLKKLGTILLQTGQVVAGIKPFFPILPDNIEGHVRRAVDSLEEAAEIIVTVEAVGQALKIAGPDKLKAASPLIANIILKSDMIVGKKIKNQELFNKSVAEITSGIVGVLNSIAEDEAKAESISAEKPPQG